jgi:hypothetical protein
MSVFAAVDRVALLVILVGITEEPALCDIAMGALVWGNGLYERVVRVIERRSPQQYVVCAEPNKGDEKISSLFLDAAACYRSGFILANRCVFQ